MKLARLSAKAGVALLLSLGVKGTLTELEKLVEDAGGHALTLNLLGSYLRDAHGGDVRKRDLVKLEEADAEEQGGHAFRVMDAYAAWLEGEGEAGERALAVLRLLGLFDRPADADCLGALLKEPPIPGLTGPLAGVGDARRNVAIARLEAARLLAANRDAAAALLSLDAHPLLREYFARQLRTERPEAWRSAHERLYRHLAATPDKPRPSLEDLQPLYQAVAHGCLAGLQQEACYEVYYARICRRNEVYSIHKLGAFGADLGAVACFFEQPWSRVSPSCTEAFRSWLLGEAAFRLRALGRLAEALEPMRAGLGMDVRLEDWENAAISAGNVSELGLTLGEVAEAAADAERAVRYADRSGDAFQRRGKRSAHADALHQGGRRVESEALFREAERMQAEDRPGHPLLYSVRGFQYCDLLLGTAERAAWWHHLGSTSGGDAPSLAVSCHDASRRATQALEIAEGQKLAARHRPRPPDPGPRRPLHGDPGGVVLRYLPAIHRERRGRPAPCGPIAGTSPRPPHPRLAAWPWRCKEGRRQRSKRPGRGVGGCRARPDAAAHGRRPPAPRPPVLPREAVPLGVASGGPGRGTEAHRVLRLLAAQGGAGGRRGGRQRRVRAGGGGDVPGLAVRSRAQLSARGGKIDWRPSAPQGSGPWRGRLVSPPSGSGTRGCTESSPARFGRRNIAWSLVPRSNIAGRSARQRPTDALAHGGVGVVREPLPVDPQLTRSHTLW